jgi:alkylated DNA nucleotide flippase Atl1
LIVKKGNMFKAMYAVVKNILKGKVASYGAVARLAGYPRCSRQVGLSKAFLFSGENRQRELLERGLLGRRWIF